MTVSAVENQNWQSETTGRNRQLRRQVSEVVNNVFYGTLLRQLRESQRSDILDKGPGGTTFIRQLDLELIKRISQRGDAPMVDTIMKKITGTKLEQLYSTTTSGTKAFAADYTVRECLRGNL
jgi:hypothetical protein